MVRTQRGHPPTGDERENGLMPKRAEKQAVPATDRSEKAGFKDYEDFRDNRDGKIFIFVQEQENENTIVKSSYA